MTLVSATHLIASVLPWPTSLMQHPHRDVLVIRDLHHNFEIEIPRYRLTSVSDASRVIAESLLLYRYQINHWYGRHEIIWS